MPYILFHSLDNTIAPNDFPFGLPLSALIAIQIYVYRPFMRSFIGRNLVGNAFVENVTFERINAFRHCPFIYIYVCVCVCASHFSVCLIFLMLPIQRVRED